MTHPSKKLSGFRIPAGLSVLLIILVVFISYGNMLNYYFTSTDSFILIERGRIRSFEDITRIFSEPLAKHLPFYRPVSTLSFSLDFYLWELNPFGYHLTDLLLHIFASILLFFFARVLSCGSNTAALAAALLFTAHPVLVEVVPAIARRQEMLLSIFVLLSLLCLHANLTKPIFSKSYLALSVFFYIMAAGSKETALILPFMVFAYSVSFLSRESKTKIKTVSASAAKTLPFILAGSVFLSWRYHILSGIGGYSDMPVQAPFEIIHDYFLYLFYPVDIIGLDSMPVIAGYLPRFILAVIIIAAFFLRKRLMLFMPGSRYGKDFIFLTAWLILPLGIYMAASTFSPRYMYFSIMPFSIMLSFPALEISRSIKEPSGKSSIGPAVTGLVLTAGFLLYLISFSPAIRTYGEWKAQAEISDALLYKLSKAAGRSPDDSEIHIYDRPIFFAISGQKHHHAVTAVNINVQSIQSWLNINIPDNRFRIFSHGELITVDPKDLDIEVKADNNGKINIYFRLKQGSKQEF
ncbi:MAG: hypothetical protein HY809_08610 [Nitrospirae bacterium]|nr:hypothetical protein [Nitrospirota bacterium]